jgi:hypothetical protein
LPYVCSRHERTRCRSTHHERHLHQVRRYPLNASHLLTVRTQLQQCNLQLKQTHHVKSMLLPTVTCRCIPNHPSSYDSACAQASVLKNSYGAARPERTLPSSGSHPLLTKNIISRTAHASLESRALGVAGWVAVEKVNPCNDPLAFHIMSSTIFGYLITAAWRKLRSLAYNEDPMEFQNPD